jgi:hypothetical protein
MRRRNRKINLYTVLMFIAIATFREIMREKRQLI